ncbi:hypothetical protein Knedl_CDS0015 [Pseudomonas phage Knedl]|nr:hypothetical protein Knedl_CDS0015 [Pseudomonas phage Knedl]
MLHPNTVLGPVWACFGRLGRRVGRGYQGRAAASRNRPCFSAEGMAILHAYTTEGYNPCKT